MHNQMGLIGTFARQLLRQQIRHVLFLVSALICTVAAAETGYAPTKGYIPTEQDVYPKPIAAIPAVLSQCFACHGPNGHSEYNDWPSLAGQKQSYLLTQLRNFKSGERKHPMMLPVVEVLTDDDFKVAAEYLSMQAPPQPKKAANTAAPTAAAVCIACHDNAALPVEPYLHAQQPDYLAAQIRAFQSGERHSEIMQPMVKGLTDEQVSELAEYFSTQTPILSAK